MKEMDERNLSFPKLSLELEPAGGVMLLTGLSGAGKSTLATHLLDWLKSKGCAAALLDGDKLRDGLNKDLGFSEKDRVENLRRVAEIAKVLSDQGLICICAHVAPYEVSREFFRQRNERYLEVFVNCQIQTLRNRDTKGLYAKADSGQIQLTGVHNDRSARYEIPEKPDLIIITDQESIQDSIQKLIHLLQTKNWVN